MKKIHIILATFVTLFACYSCNEDVPEAGFKDMERQTIYDYIVENDSLYSKFLQILEKGELDKTVSAYNPNGNDYTLFLPTNEAIDLFIAESSLFNSFDDLLNNDDYLAAMARYHVVNRGYLTNDFPFGALDELNLYGQNITIGFEIGTDSSYYKINNEAPLVQGNIEVSNGYIHVISKALTPITFTTTQWLEQTNGYSIFNEAVKQTGLDEILSRVIERDTISLNPVTLFVEPDSVYHRNNIMNFDDLAAAISPNNTEYTSPYNNLYNFVACHILEGSLFLSNFEEQTSNYNTFGNVPVNVNGIDELDLAINRGKQIFDTIISEVGDTTYLNYITFYYDVSNVFTLSGSVHLINQIMLPQNATVANQYFEFFEEPLFNIYRDKGGEYLVQDQSLLSTLSWTGGTSDLLFVKSLDEEEPAWNDDYIMMQGDFTLTYQLPKIVQGEYNVRFRAHANSIDNALVEVFLDGVKIGGLIDLTTGGSSNDPYVNFDLGRVTFLEYKNHEIKVKTLIPGILYWDVIYFEKPSL